MGRSGRKSTLGLRKKCRQSQKSLHADTILPSLTTHFETNYLDEIASKWESLGKLDDSTPPNVAYSLAFSFEHPYESPSFNGRLLLLNYLRAHKARAPSGKGAIHSLSIAHGSYIDGQSGKKIFLNSTFGTNATRHNVDNARKVELVWRADFAYSKEWYPDGLPPSNMGNRPNTQCAEMVSLPLILRSIEGMPSATSIVITSYTINATSQRPMKMCGNCAAYAKWATQRRLGLRIVDVAGDSPVLYESIETKRKSSAGQFDGWHLPM